LPPFGRDGLMAEIAPQHHAAIVAIPQNCCAPKIGQ
jgi:hypothetical protein